METGMVPVIKERLGRRWEVGVTNKEILRKPVQLLRNNGSTILYHHELKADSTTAFPFLDLTLPLDAHPDQRGPQVLSVLV